MAIEIRVIPEHANKLQQIPQQIRDRGTQLSIFLGLQRAMNLEPPVHQPFFVHKMNTVVILLSSLGSSAVG